MDKASQKVRTKVVFDPSCDVVDAVASGNVGQACHKVRWFINHTEQGTITIPPGEDFFTVECEVGSEEKPNIIGVVISAFNRDGMQSQATPYEFRVMPHVPPSRPRNLAVVDVTPLSEPEPEAAKKPKLPQSPDDNNEPIFFNITVIGHPEIKDGAVGTIVGRDVNDPNTVKAIFGSEAVKPNVQCPVTGLEFAFSPASTCNISIITPDQETITLAQFLTIPLAP